MSERTVLEIPSSGALDAITVFWENISDGKGSVVITCWGSAWTCYWGGMGTESIQEFFRTRSTSYLAEKLGNTQWLKQTKAHEKYLSRIIDAIKSALNAPKEEAPS